MSVYEHDHKRNGRAPKGAAFYDLDGTLMGLNLVHGTLFAFTNIGEWTGRVSYVLGLATRLPMLYLAERRDRHLLNVTLFEMFKGISRDRLVMLGEEYCDRILMANMYPRAIEMVGGKSRSRPRTGAGDGIAGFYRRAVGRPSRYQDLRRQPTGV